MPLRSFQFECHLDHPIRSTIFPGLYPPLVTWVLFEHSGWRTISSSQPRYLKGQFCRGSAAASSKGRAMPRNPGPERKFQPARRQECSMKRPPRQGQIVRAERGAPFSARHVLIIHEAKNKIKRYVRGLSSHEPMRLRERLLRRARLFFTPGWRLRPGTGSHPWSYSFSVFRGLGRFLWRLPSSVRTLAQ